MALALALMGRQLGGQAVSAPAIGGPASAPRQTSVEVRRATVIRV